MLTDKVKYVQYTQSHTQYTQTQNVFHKSYRQQETRPPSNSEKKQTADNKKMYNKNGSRFSAVRVTNQIK